MMRSSQNIRKVFALAAVLMVMTFAFWPSLSNGFTSWDDNIYVVENEMIRDLSWLSIKNIFTTDVSLNYTPLVSLSFAAEYHFFGYNPFVYHLDNLLLHLLVTALIFIFSKQLSSSVTVAVVAALLFGIHPMHVESVAWVTERKDVLYAAFYLGALIFYWQYLLDKRKLFFVVALVCGFLSILAKPMALSLPFVLLVLDWFFKRKWDFKIILEKIPFAALMFSIAWLTYSLNSRSIALKFPDAVLTWIWTFVFYLKKFFLPFEFLPLYQLPKPVALINPEFLISVIVFLAIIVAIIRYRKNRWLVFAFLFYFASIFFILRFDDSSDLQVVADRFMYLPSLGFCLLLGVGFKRLFDQKLFYGVFVVLVLFLGFSTFQQTKIWGDGISFWSRVIKRYPGAFMAYNQRALEYKQKGNLDNALRDYTKAIDLFPLYDYALTNRGIVYKELGRYQDAWNDHSRAITINPGFSEAYLNRGNVSFSSGRFSEAIADYDKAIINLNVSARHNSTVYRAEVYSRRGAGYFFMKNYPAALADFDHALAIDPDNIVALDNRAIIFSINGQKDTALIDFARSLKLAPQNPVTYANRAQLYYQNGDKMLAMRDVETALTLNPSNKRALELKMILNK